MWFHRRVRVDDWLLYSTDSPSASGARGFARGSIFARDGRLVASTAQEGLIAHGRYMKARAHRSCSWSGVMIGGLSTLRSTRNAGMPERGRAGSRQGARARRARRANRIGRETVGLPRQLPDFTRQHVQVAVPPAILGTPVLAKHRLPAHPDFLEDADRCALFTSTVEMMRSARRSKNAASMSAMAISWHSPCPIRKFPACSPGRPRCARSATNRRRR